ncbi:MAG: hypothetical protein RI980_797 [Bacteroidota bacterium]|jgi:hypothetical protein
MTIKNRIFLELFTLLFGIVYYLSFFNIALLYLFSGLYYPINKSGLKEIVPFEIFVLTICLAILLLIYFKMKYIQFSTILLQNIFITIFSFPLLYYLFLISYEGLNGNEDSEISFIFIAILSFAFVQINNFRKITFKNKTDS